MPHRMNDNDVDAKVLGLVLHRQDGSMPQSAAGQCPQRPGQHGRVGLHLVVLQALTWDGEARLTWMQKL